jgi:hypothetical protein
MNVSPITLDQLSSHNIILGCLHTTMTLHDITMVVFPIFLKYKKVNKIKFIEIIKKGLTYLKLS